MCLTTELTTSYTCASATQHYHEMSLQATITVSATMRIDQSSGWRLKLSSLGISPLPAIWSAHTRGTPHNSQHVIRFSISGVAIGCEKCAVHEGPSLCVEGGGTDEPCVGKRGALLESLHHTGPLQPIATPLHFAFLSSVSIEKCHYSDVISVLLLLICFMYSFKRLS